MRILRTSVTLACFAATLATALAQTPLGPPADPRATDPVKLGWMIGSPPAPDKIIRARDAYRFPQWRWSFSHWRELVPTVEVSRGATPVSALPRAERADLDAVTFTPMGGGAPMTWADSLVANHTDGI